MRKVFITLTVHLTVDADEGISMDEVVQEMDYNFMSETDGADIVDTQIVDFEVTDSK